ncbi:serine/threonine protein kinase [Nocardioides albidus]|uniref:non-specific serine/threonine protein kinase n=1 Tax=Nocardioides albidus TaxID=1517589 RepID=A0A5C4WRL2_9ACTN|nr:serine/threonine-protein kinase [Nocardioides albidus]TNM50827.1 serine/threonine protein kinase [Nocardioides albidus]
MSTPLSSWGFAEGDAITPELTALRPLGGGSAYEAYLAFDEITYGPVVAKVVRPDAADDEQTLRALVREATALDVAHHPVVVRGLRHDVDAARPHLVLEHVEGPSLSRLIRRHRRLSPQQYLPLAVDLASALHFFRHADVCHLDLKPSNVIMGSPARLIDFSVARQSASAAEITGQIGTDAYMAPEQAAPGDAYGVPGHASDLWGLGTTLFHAIAGYRPFRDGDPDLTEPAGRFPQLLDAPVELPADVPSAVAKVVHALLEPDPADRPLPREVAEALEPEIAALPAPRLHWKG